MAGGLVHTGEILHVKQHFSDLVVLGRELVRHLTADHQADDFFLGEFFRRLCGDPLAVAHDRHVVRDPEDLIHLVADVDDADAILRQLVHDAEEVIDLVLCQGAGGLIQNQDLRIVGDGLGDLHHLAFGHGQLSDDLPRINVDLELLEDSFRVSVHFCSIHKAESRGREAAQPDVFHDVAAEHLVQFLVHHGHAVIQSIPGAGEGHRLSVH